ncbi:MAG TPA: tRNA dihydrouridine synthase DusB [Syntrophales bacterium]|nr:tRNA dihydrouridine synthase DusB [Syntrophales bacterium]HOH73227.1 tRNA dihydrouridine synthase DusB [Syntrophales bacterium]HPN09452.1 tRNA dihydrouridine synthase DusB [Syntrophales bacterium]HPX81788.1 tRNA dihydrouridine synthase DusB [Syntrophales bacterium]HQB13996.1 tRNA dihydrouridine synthase DusB [Syntrophales bacterium]
MKIDKLDFDVPVFLAPMAGITNLPFRTIVRRCGCQLAFTEMVSVNGLVRGAERTCRYLDGASEDRPLGVQIFGAEAEIMAAGARIATDRGADLIDINMGCPVKKVVRAGAGSALLKDPAKVGRIVSAVRRATSLPLTVKIRAGWRRSVVNAIEIARIAEAEGADAVIVHPRTADQGFSGRADWSIIRAVKDALGIPVIGNGDIRRAADVGRMMTATACDGVMIGRAALGNPWIFQEIINGWPVLSQQGSLGEARVDVGRMVSASISEDAGDPTVNSATRESLLVLEQSDVAVNRRLPVSFIERERVIREHLDLERRYTVPKIGVQNFRKHILWYTKGLPGSASFRQRLSELKDVETLLVALGIYFCQLNNALDFS